MRMGILLLLVMCMGFLGNVETVASAADYIEVPPPPDGWTMNPKEATKSGEPITADINLKRVGEILPEESRLNLSTDVVNPWVQVDIDGDIQTFANKNEIEIPLSQDGVNEISISMRGNAPNVEKLTKLKVIDIKTYVRYKGVGGEYQDEILLTLDVSNPDIEDTLEAISTANQKISTAESLITALNAQGVNTVELDSRLLSAKKVVENAQSLYDQEFISLAKSNADTAIELLDGIIDDANELQASAVQTTDIKRYLTAGVIIVIVLLVLLFLRGRLREELG